MGEWELIQTAVRCAMLELHFQGTPEEKLGVVCSALLDVIDTAMFYGVIDDDSTRLPDDINFYLKGVYHYLGDPL